MDGLAFVPFDLPPKLERARLRDEIFDELADAESALARLEGSAGDLRNSRMH